MSNLRKCRTISTGGRLLAPLSLRDECQTAPSVIETPNYIDDDNAIYLHLKQIALRSEIGATERRGASDMTSFVVTPQHP